MTRAISAEDRAYFSRHSTAETMGALLAAQEAQPGHETMRYEQRGVFNRAWLAGAWHERRPNAHGGLNGAEVRGARVALLPSASSRLREGRKSAESHNP